MLISIFVTLGMLLPLAFPCTPTECYIKQGDTAPYCPEGTSTSIKWVMHTCRLGQSGPITHQTPANAALYTALATAEAWTWGLMLYQAHRAALPHLAAAIVVSHGRLKEARAGVGFPRVLQSATLSPSPVVEDTITENQLSLACATCRRA